MPAPGGLSVVAPPASLRGCADEGGVDAEMRADAVGRRILLAAGLPDDAMLRMLRKLHAAMCSTECRTGIARRIASLDSTRQ